MIPISATFYCLLSSYGFRVQFFMNSRLVAQWYFATKVDKNVWTFITLLTCVGKRIFLLHKSEVLDYSATKQLVMNFLWLKTSPTKLVLFWIWHYFPTLTKANSKREQHRAFFVIRFCIKLASQRFDTSRSTKVISYLYNV